MKIKAVLMVLFAAGVMLVQAASLTDARASIRDCINNPAKMTEMVKSLSAEDQIAFVGEVNAAIAKMPGSNEKKAATYLNANKAMLKGAQKKNSSSILAEIFATVAIDVLPLLNERFAADLYNRAADPSKTYTDDAFEAIATNTFAKIVARTESVENGSPRAAFAALMFVRASNGTPEGLRDTLVSMMPASAHEVAQKEWLPAALGEGRPQSYEPLLGAADTFSVMPSNDVVIRIAGPQLLESMLGDLVETTPVINPHKTPEFQGTPVFELPNDTTPPVPPAKPETPIRPVPPPEPGPYQNQSL